MSNPLQVRNRHFFVLVPLLAVVVVLMPTTAASVVPPDTSPGVSATACPWVSASQEGTMSPRALATQVVGRMTLQQKISFVVLSVRDGVENINAGIPDLCIPPLTLSDGPNGIAYGVSGSTQLPASIGLAASFNPAVTYAVGQVEGAEAAAKGIDVVQGPELNLARVPVSGRVFEGYGEDPNLTAAMGLADVVGIQSQGVMAMAKHVTAYNEETDRSRLNQDLTLRELEELYDAPFVPIVQQLLLVGASPLTVVAWHSLPGALSQAFSVAASRFYGFSTLGQPLQLFALAPLFALATSFMGQAAGA